MLRCDGAASLIFRQNEAAKYFFYGKRRVIEKKFVSLQLETNTATN
jgi:hypothetical protein